MPLVLDANVGHDGLSLTTERKYFILCFLKHLFVGIGFLHVQRSLIMAQDFCFNIYSYFNTCGTQRKLFVELKTQFPGSSPGLFIKPSYLSVMVRSLMLNFCYGSLQKWLSSRKIMSYIFQFFQLYFDKYKHFIYSTLLIYSTIVALRVLRLVRQFV